jgi:hypothetical protein
MKQSRPYLRLLIGWTLSLLAVVGMLELLRHVAPA